MNPRLSSLQVRLLVQTLFPADKLSLHKQLMRPLFNLPRNDAGNCRLPDKFEREKWRQKEVYSQSKVNWCSCRELYYTDETQTYCFKGFYMLTLGTKLDCVLQVPWLTTWRQQSSVKQIRKTGSKSISGVSSHMPAHTKLSNCLRTVNFWAMATKHCYM